MQLQAVFATDDNGGIGYNNSLPWPFNRKDMESFIETTKNTILIMGKNTWYSLPNKLKGRVHIVISSAYQQDLVHKGQYPDRVINSKLPLDKIQEEVNIVTEMYQIPIVSIIGGKQTYELLLPITDYIYHTKIKGEYVSDTFLDLNELTNNFSEVSTSILDNDKVYLTKYQRNLIQ